LHRDSGIANSSEVAETIKIKPDDTTTIVFNPDKSGGNPGHQAILSFNQTLGHTV